MLDLIEGRRPDGILPILDDQIRVRNGNDSTFYKNICETHAANPKFKRMRKPTTDTAFGEWPKFDFTSPLDIALFLFCHAVCIIGNCWCSGSYASRKHASSRLLCLPPGFLSLACAFVHLRSHP